MQKTILTAICLTSINLHANVLQYFAGISYSNPAELFKVKKNDFIVGGMSMYVDAKFSGSVLNLNTFQYGSGINHSRRVSLLPYGRIASRLKNKLVFGVDITQPFHSNLVWGDNPFTRYASVETLMTDTDVSPRVSLSINPKFYVGAGLNFNFLKNNETNWALPISQTQYATLINRTSSFGVGYDLGLYYIINPSNFFGATYYSSIRQKTRGESWLGTNVNNNIIFNFRMPATTILNYVHIFSSKKWLTSLQLFRTEWNVNQFARIRNTAALPPSPQNFSFTMQYQESYAYSAAIRRQMDKKTGVTLIGMLDTGPEHDHLRTINFPSDNQYFIAVAGDYHFNDTTAIELLYGKGFSNTRIRNTIAIAGPAIPFTTGKVGITADIVDLKIKIQM